MKGLPRSLKHANRATSPVPLKHTITLDAFAMTNLDGATGVGWATAVVGDFPEGNILVLGCVASLQFTGPTSAGLVDTWAGDFGVGSTPASDGTISVGDVDLIPSTALAAATAEVSPVTRASLAASVTLDNTDGSLEINLNLLVDDVDISADDLTMLVSGSIDMTYAVLGDD